MVYTVYKTTNTQNSRYYIGAHKTDDPYDGYLGSGLAIKRAITYYGKDTFTKEVLFVFDTEEAMYLKEKELIEKHIDDPKCYNLMEGGVGGFSHINSQRHMYQNPMKNPEIVKKNLESRSEGYSKDIDRIRHHREKRLENLKKAVQTNTGSKKPNHSQFMKINSRIVDLWKNDREYLRDCISSTYKLISPQGEEYITNRLGELCEEHNLPFTTVWGNSKSELPISKGKAKGWKCIILNN
jgi:hypothetical protein